MKPVRLCAFPVTLFVVAALAAGPAAQAPPSVTWTIALEPAATTSVARGGRISVAVTARIAEGWHVYGLEELKGGPRPLGISVPPGQPFKAAGKLQAPEPEREFDASFEQVTTFYNKTTTFRLPVTVSRQATAGPASINVEVAFQACDGRICLPGRTVKLSAPLEIR